MDRGIERNSTRATVVAFAGILLAAPPGIQSETHTFVIRTEIDTVAVEQLTRSADTLTGELRLLSERTYVHYALHLRPDGSTESADVFDEAPGFYTGKIVFGPRPTGVDRSKSEERVVTVPPDYLPIIGVSMGLIDYVIRLHTPKPGEAVELKVINIRNRFPGRLHIKRVANDSVLVDCDGCMRPRTTEELRIALARDGGIEGAVRAEQHWTIVRR